ISISLQDRCGLGIVMMDDKNVIYNIGTLLSFQATNRILNPSQMLAGVSYRSFSVFCVTRLGNSFSL
ncbi:hypothetical protein, partial [Rothia nasimurium]|uniref:hypothetical protein n=1 Tax=Rothia nasimurium TaxID=85336 RepID=UPI001F229D17